MICIGIDLGLDGAIAFLWPNGTASVDDLPTCELPGEGAIRREVDCVALYALLHGRLPRGVATMTLIEQVHAFGRAAGSAQSDGSLMHTRGVVETTFRLARLALYPSVAPQTWKKHFRLRGGRANKGESLDVARRLYPRLGETSLTLVKHQNRAEAVLIARYLQRMCLGISIEEETGA